MFSHTYVEPENRGKLHALARHAAVTLVVPNRWQEGAFGRSWQIADGADGALSVLAARWTGPLKPSRGLMRLPRRALQAGAILQIEEEPWTPTARMALGRGPFARRVLFTWENIDRRMPPPWSFWRRTVLRSVDGVIAGNRDAGDVAQAQGFRGPVAVIPQLGVELPPARRRAERPPAVAFVGRLVPEKGVDLLLRAFADWSRGSGAEASLNILGDGPERANLEKLAAELGITGRTRFLGARPHAEVAALWPDVDVLVLPSRTTSTWREQLGHVLLEAMAHEVVVVGSSSGAIPEVIGEAGLTFREDDHGALRDALDRLSDTGLRARLAAAGRARVEEHYTNDRIAARTLELHDQVLALDPHPTPPAR